MGTKFSLSLVAVVHLTIQSSCAEETKFASQDIPRIPYNQDKVVEKTFQAGGLLTETVHIDPKNLTLEHDLFLTEKPSVIVSSKQKERPHYIEEFVQGGQGRDYLDSFPILESGYLDLLIVIDDSQSMTMFQDLIKDRFSDLLGKISNTNWRIAVATTSSSCLRTTFDNTKILTRYDFDRFPLLTHQRFQELISAGNSGSTIEKGILTASQALTGDCGDPAFNWTRGDSQKVVLLVSDEKNCGSASNEGCMDQEYASADYFLNRMPSQTRVYGLLLFKDNFSECPDSGAMTISILRNTKDSLTLPEVPPRRSVSPIILRCWLEFQPMFPSLLKESLI